MKLLQILIHETPNEIYKSIIDVPKNKKYFFEDVISNNVRFLLMNRSYKSKGVILNY
jgi:hypothetical protein